MKLKFVDSYIECHQEQSDPRMKNESHFFYHLKLALNKQGYDLIKKLMWKDGHMTDDLRYYLRQKKIKKNEPCAMVIDDAYYFRNTAKAFNDGNYVNLNTVDFPKL